MRLIPDIEVDADKSSTFVMAFFFVVLLISIPWHIAWWVQGKMVVSTHTGWEQYMVFVLIVYTAIRTRDKGIRIISILLACMQGARIALHIVQASSEWWHVAGQGLALGEMVLEVGIVVGIAIWFKNRVRIVKAPHNA
jgi:hypothetical protein